MSPALARELDELCESNTPTWKVHHNTKLPGVHSPTPDSNWIAKLTEIDANSSWLIISHDHGKNDRKESERLPMVCKANNRPYVIVSNTIGRTSEQKEAITAVLKHFMDDVPRACEKLRHRRTPHVKLARITLKGGIISHHLRVGAHSIERFLAPAKAPIEKGDDFNT